MNADIANLSANLLAGVVSDTLAKMLADRETEKRHLEAQTQRQPAERVSLPAPSALTELFATRAERLTGTLDQDSVHGEAAEILSRLIESVKIYPGADGTAEEEVVAKVGDLAAWAVNDNAAPEGGVWCSIPLVAGTCGQLGLLTRSCWPSD